MIWGGWTKGLSKSGHGWLKMDWPEIAAGGWTRGCPKVVMGGWTGWLARLGCWWLVKWDCPWHPIGVVECHPIWIALTLEYPYWILPHPGVAWLPHYGPISLLLGLFLGGFIDLKNVFYRSDNGIGQLKAKLCNFYLREPWVYTFCVESCTATLVFFGKFQSPCNKNCKA